MMRAIPRWVYAVVVAALVLVACLLIGSRAGPAPADKTVAEKESDNPRASALAAATPGGDKAATPAATRPAVAPAAQVQKVSLASLAEPPLHFMDAYATAGSTPAADMAMIQSTVQAYLISVPVEVRPPAGCNREFTQALTGANPIHIAFLSPDNPAIVNGELVDRWGTPLFFHFESSHQIDARSAGPDRRMWTTDDIEVP